MADNCARAEAAGLHVTAMPVLPFVEMHGRRVACPHLNLYVSNAAVIVPIAGAASDADALSVIEAAFPGPATTLASRGGGPRCITQQVPSGASPAVDRSEGLLVGAREVRDIGL
jgi:agmatine deiminase